MPFERLKEESVVQQVGTLVHVEFSLCSKLRMLNRSSATEFMCRVLPREIIE